MQNTTTAFVNQPEQRRCAFHWAVGGGRSSSVWPRGNSGERSGGTPATGHLYTCTQQGFHCTLYNVH